MDPNGQGGGGTGTIFQLQESVHFEMEVAVATSAILPIKDGASPMCRKKLLIVVSCSAQEWSLSYAPGSIGRRSQVAVDWGRVRRFLCFSWAYELHQGHWHGVREEDIAS